MKQFTVSLLFFVLHSTSHGAFLYNCRNGFEQLEFSTTSFSGKPFLNYKSDQAEFHLIGEELDVSLQQEGGFSVYAQLNHQDYTSLSVFLPHPTKGVQALPVPTISHQVKSAVRFTDREGMPLLGEPMICQVIDIEY